MKKNSLHERIRSALRTLSTAVFDDGPGADHDIRPAPWALDPLQSNRWIFVLPGVDAYAVSKVALPDVGPQGSLGQLIVTFYNPAGVNINGELLRWLDDPEPRKGSLRFLDKTGRVSESWEFESLIPLGITVGARLQGDALGPLDYEGDALMMTRLELECSDLTITTS